MGWGGGDRTTLLSLFKYFLYFPCSCGGPLTQPKCWNALDSRHSPVVSPPPPRQRGGHEKSHFHPLRGRGEKSEGLNGREGPTGPGVGGRSGHSLKMLLDLF